MPTQKEKAPPFSARPFLEPSYLLTDSRPEIDRALTRDRASDPGPAFGPGGSDPAAAVRVSARRPAVDPASARGSGSAGRDSGSDWTLRSPFFQSREETTVEPAFGCAETRVPRWLSPVWPNCGSDTHLIAAKNYFCTSSRGTFQRSCRHRFPLLKNGMTRRPAAGAFAVSEVETAFSTTANRIPFLPENAPTVGSVWIISPSN